MKSIWKFSVLGVLILGTYLVVNGFMPETNKGCTIENTAFHSGEHLVYKAYYNLEFLWIPAGEAVFDIVEKGNYYDVTVTGTSYKTYDAFFKVRDYFHSKIDKRTMYPTEFVRVVEEGDYRRFDSLIFIKELDSAISYSGKTRNTAEKKVVRLDECTHDLLSVLYFLRNINVNNYKVGDHIPTNVLFEDTQYPIRVRLNGKEQNKYIKGLGIFNTVEVVPDLITGTVFKEGNKMHIWVTDDKNKLPLLIESPLSVGSAKAVLKTYKGLRNPLCKKD